MPAAIGPNGARARKNTSRRSLLGRPRRRYAAIASPTSAGSGSRSSRATLAPHDQLAGPPVDVIESQPGHLTAPQPQPQQRDQHRVVAPPDRRATITAGQQRLGVGAC